MCRATSKHGMTMATDAPSADVSACSRSDAGLLFSATALPDTLSPLQAVGEIQPGRRINGLQGERPLELHDSIGASPLRHQRVPKVVMSIHPTRVARDQTTVCLDGLVELTRLLEREGAPEQRFRSRVLRYR